MILELKENNFRAETWAWDLINKSPDVTLSVDRKAAYFHIDPVKESTGTAGVLGDQGFQDGEHYWEVHLLEPARGSSVMIGVATKDACLHLDSYQFVNLIGRDVHSWGLSYKGTVWHNGESRVYCTPFFTASTIIGVHLNLIAGTLTFFKDGQDLGVAFSGIKPGSIPLYPMLSSTATNTEMELGVSLSRYMSLKRKCCHVIASSMRDKQNVGYLPLPKLLQSCVKEFQ